MHTNNIRFYITEACNAKCPNCFNKENRNETYMDVDRFEELCLYFSKNGGTQIKIMGGEPTIHPNFEEIMRIAQLRFPVVSLFTNALSSNLLKFKPRAEDIITYNFKFRRRLNNENMFLDLPGVRNLEIQVKGIKFGQDHLIPLCFLTNTKIPMPKNGTNCLLNCAGLVDSNYNLRFCNQYPDILTNMYKDDEIIPVSLFAEKLKEKYDEILYKISKKGCGPCAMFRKYCNGGCFLGKSVIPTISPKF